MTIRGFMPSTQRGYLAAVENFTAFLGRSPDIPDAEDLRRYQLHMRSNNARNTGSPIAWSVATINLGPVTVGRGAMGWRRGPYCVLGSAQIRWVEVPLAPG